MRTTRLAVAAFAALSIPNAAAAQRIVADISVQQGPVAGRIVIGDPHRHGPRDVAEVPPRYHDRREYRPVTVYRMHRGHGWYEHQGFRRVRVWYDADRERYYDRYDAHAGLREIVVYERDGRYYRDDQRNDDRRGHDRNDNYGDRD